MATSNTATIPGQRSAAARARGWLHRRLPRLLPGGEPEQLPLVVHRRRIYILPTRAGLFFGLLLMVMLLGALNYNNNPALLLTYLLGGVMLVAPVHTHRNLAGLRVTGCHADPVFAGQRARYLVHLANDEPRPRCAVRARGAHDADQADLPPRGKGRLRLEQPAPRRGWMAAARIRLFTEYPLGMYHAWSWLDAPGRVLVYPAPEADPPPLPFAGEGGLQGAQADREEEFAGLRDYRPGDPSRLIAWKALARTDELMSKAFHSPNRRTVWLDYRAIPGLHTEARLSRLTAWLLEAHRRQLDYGLRLPRRELPPSHDESHRLACLEALALFRP